MTVPFDDAPAISQAGYTHPEVLVSTDWVDEYRDNPAVRVAESDEDVLLYELGHIPGAVKIDWHTELNDPVVRDYVDREGFERLLSQKGIGNDTTVVLYGDKNNWWACYAFWVFKLFGHPDVRIMNGGRQKWLEEGREVSKTVPELEPADYDAPGRDDAPIRIFRDGVLTHMEAGKRLVDVRSPAEYAGTLLHMPDYPQEGALRGGHIPGANSIPWGRAIAEDGTFKPADALRTVYESEHSLQAGQEIVTYCRIGERSSHTWFVLTYLLGYPNVRNYDGSWAEWGNLVRAPVRR